jgi:uncharacterized protein (DUF1800 family)
MTTAWQPYKPTSDAPWNLRRVVHLHRRAGFAATWSELQRDLAGEPQVTVTRVLASKPLPQGERDKNGPRIDGQPADYEATSALLVDAAVTSQLDRRLKAAWVYRMLFTPDPLGERLTLMWHNHFATSNRKVKNLKQMQQQNDVLRRLARAPFGELLSGVVRDPAMLVWLDADKNLADHPNENLGRELMELFTLGVGHYSEDDVQQAARALTGWKVVADQWRADAAGHDDGEKTILGVTQKFTGDDLLKLLVDQPAAAQRLAWRICDTLMGEKVVDRAAIDALAAGLREHDLNIGWAVETVLRSRRFFADENLRSRVIGPPEYVVGAVRALECFRPTPSTLLLADWMSRMGQDLFYPPNVGGWSQGRAWLSSGAIIARANFASALVTGRLMADAQPPDFTALVDKQAGTKQIRPAVEWLGQLLFGGLAGQEIDSTVEIGKSLANKSGGEIPAAIVVLLSRPEAHLG